MKSLRTEANFNLFYDEVKQASSCLTEEPILPRYRKTPKRYDDGSNPHQYQSPRHRYRHAYFEVLEVIAGEVNRRFDQPDLKIIRDIENLMINASNQATFNVSDELVTYLKDDIDCTRLKHQLLTIPDLVRTAFSADSVTIKKVTNVRTIADAMDKCNIYKGMLTEIDKLLKLYFTFPVTSATAERSFSSLRRLKTYLRSTMTCCRLNNLFLLYVYKDKTDQINLQKIAKEFTCINSRRLNYFGKF